MKLTAAELLELPPTADMHVHLRQAELMKLAVPTLGKGGVDTAFVYGGLLSEILMKNTRTNQGTACPILYVGNVWYSIGFISLRSQQNKIIIRSHGTYAMLMYSRIGASPHDR